MRSDGEPAALPTHNQDAWPASDVGSQTARIPAAKTLRRKDSRPQRREGAKKPWTIIYKSHFSCLGAFAAKKYADPSAYLRRAGCLETSSPSYSWDAKSHLVQLVSSSSGTVTYTYDVDGIRTSKSVGGIITKYVVDKNRDFAQVLEERNIAGTVQIAYIYGDDLLSQENTTVAPLLALHFYHHDGQDSVRQLTDASANITDTYTFDAFGVTLALSGTTANNYLYTSEQLDPQLSFYYLRARFLNPSVGRFISQDPWSDTDGGIIVFNSGRIPFASNAALQAFVESFLGVPVKAVIGGP